MSRRVDLDAWDWLEPDGGIPRGPAERRRRALLIARCIEYGGPLAPGAHVFTLIPCQRRPGGAACRGLLAVGKDEGGKVAARCPACECVVLRVSGWESTPWAEGPVERGARAPEKLASAEEGGIANAGGQAASLIAGEPDSAPEPTSIPDAVDQRLSRVLLEMGSGLDAAAVRRHIALARTPSKVVELVASSGIVPDEAALESLCDVLIDAWNHTPRAELGGRTPAQMSRAMAMPADAAKMCSPTQRAGGHGTDAPCLCGSGAPAAQCCAPQFH